MADHSRTQDALDSDTDALRRRARRRLVGAIAIALVAVLVVPMLFDPDPKPLGSDVDIRIPEQNTPFTLETGTDQAPLISPEGRENGSEGADAEVTQTSPEVLAHTIPPKVAEPTRMGAPPRPLEKAPLASEKKSDDLPVPARPEPGQSTDKTRPAQTNPMGATEKAKAEAKSETRSETRSETKAETKTPTQAEPVFASRGYYLQLGAFTSKVNAQDMLNKARDAGFSASMMDSSGHYRVRVGPIPERDRALDTLTRLKAKGFKPVLMGP